MAGHAQLKFVMTECSKTPIRLRGPTCAFSRYINLQLIFQYTLVLWFCGGCLFLLIHLVPGVGLWSLVVPLPVNRLVVFSHLSNERNGINACLYFR